jgi:prolyl 4-hydroxylase
MEHVARPSPDAEAAHDMAIGAAEGIDVPQNWATALDYLQRAAELGSLLAQAELAGLSGHWALAWDILAGKAMTESWWPRLRNAIDPAQLLPATRSTLLSESPRMAIVKDLATPEICDWLIARARPRLKRAIVYAFDRETPELRTENVRTNSDCSFGRSNRDFFMSILRAHIAELTQTQLHAMEPPMILNYTVGQEFRRHFDTPADPNMPGVVHRTITLLLSLNDDYEGGETTFPAVDGRWKGRKGTAIYFWNVGPDGVRDRRSLHAGTPITRGEKWLLTQFIGRPKGV